MFTQLPTVAHAQLTDIICAVQGYVSPSSPGVSVQETLGQISSLINNNFILFSFSNPNGLTAGTLYQLCWDIGDKLLYVCTTAGTASTVVWTPCIGQLTNGQLRIGSAGNPPVAATLTAGTNIAITNASGAITISSTGGSDGLTWNAITSGSASGVTNNGYVANFGTLVTISVPSISSFGDRFAIVGEGVGGWRISQAAGQKINIGHTPSSVGVSGSISSTNQYDSISLLCIVANTVWSAFTAPQGNITIV